MNTEFLNKYDMLPHGARVLCAVSGGRDSMCLLHMLWTEHEALDIELVAAHYNHGLRGGESDADCEFVRKKCREQGIPFVSEKGDVRAYAEANGMGVEDAARTLRYDFLRRTASEHACDRIATAHNADDNAETVLMNLMRGTGLKGLCGIPPVRDGIIRPILYLSRDEINAYVGENGIEYVEDSTNSSDDYTRNRIRHRVIPVLKELEPELTRSVFRASQLLREDETCLDAMAEDFITRYYVDGSLPCDKLAALHEAISARVFRKLCGRGLTSAHVGSIRGIMNSEGYAATDVPGMRVAHDHGKLYFGRQEQKLAEYELIPGERVYIPEAGLEVTVRLVGENDGNVNSKLNIFDFNFAAICGKILLTSRRDGDKIRLVGRGCTKSLKSLFSERGMSQTERDMTPVLRDTCGVIAVAGFGVAERCAAKKGENTLRVTIIKNNQTGENYRDDK